MIFRPSARAARCAQRAVEILQRAGEAALPDLTRATFEDPSGRTNPRIPLVAEVMELLRVGFGSR